MNPNVPRYIMLHRNGLAEAFHTLDAVFKAIRLRRMLGVLPPKEVIDLDAPREDCSL